MSSNQRISVEVPNNVLITNPQHALQLFSFEMIRQRQALVSAMMGLEYRGSNGTTGRVVDVSGSTFAVETKHPETSKVDRRDIPLTAQRVRQLLVAGTTTRK